MPFAQRALEIARANYGELHPEVVRSLVLLGELEHLAGDNAAAIANLLGARSILQKAMSTQQAIYAIVLLELGTAYLADGSVWDAEKTL